MQGAFRVKGAALALLLVLPAAAPPEGRAAEPKGCDAFKWPLAAEAARLQAAAQAKPEGARADEGRAVDAKPDGTAYALPLVPLADAHLPQPPERKPKVEPSRAGFLTFAGPAAGSYQVAISQAAWIDVVQEGHTLKPTAFTGATDCPGVRKSLRVDLAAKPFLIQISGTAATAAALLVEPVPAGEAGASKSP